MMEKIILDVSATIIVMDGGLTVDSPLKTSTPHSVMV